MDYAKEYDRMVEQSNRQLGEIAELTQQRDELQRQVAEIGQLGVQLREQRDELLAASQTVIDRWDTPLWKDVPATAVYIGELRAAIAKVKP